MTPDDWSDLMHDPPVVETANDERSREVEAMERAFRLWELRNCTDLQWDVIEAFARSHGRVFVRYAL